MMKKLALILMFVATLVFIAAVPPPAPMREWINSWTTNRGVLPVMGSNNLAITNRIAGAGGGTTWLFYGISPNTVARQTDVVNIARSVVASSNGNWVAIGSQVWTNDGNFVRFVGPTNQAVNIRTDGALFIGSNTWASFNNLFADYRPFPYSVSIVASNDPSLSVAYWAVLDSLDYNWYSSLEFLNFGSANQSYSTLEMLATDTNQSSRFAISLNDNPTILFSDLTTGFHPFRLNQDGTLIIRDGYSTLGAGYLKLVDEASGLTSIFLRSNGASLFTGPITNTSLSPSKLVSTGTGTQLVSSAYSDQTFADLQAATNSLQTQLTAATNALNVASNALRTSLSTTGNYVLIQAGTANTMISTNGTNMGGTFKMLTGGTTPPLQVLTSNLSTALIVNTNGNVGIGTNAPAVELDVVGRIKVRDWIGFNSNDLNHVLLTNGTTAGRLAVRLGDNSGYGSINFAQAEVFNGTTRTILFYDTGTPRLQFQDANGQILWNGGTEIWYHFGTGTNGFGAGAATPTGSIEASNAVFRGAATINGTLTSKSTAYLPTNTAPIVTGSNPTNSYVIDTLYTTGAQRSLIVGSAVLNGGVSGAANITLAYTNEGVGYSLPMQTGAGLATTDIFPFCVPLSTNSSFQFVSTMGTGASGSLTNVVLWRQ